MSIQKYQREDSVIQQKDGPFLHKCREGCTVWRPVLEYLTKNMSRTMISFNKHVFKSQMALGMEKYFTVLRKRLHGKLATITRDRETVTTHPAAVSSEAMTKILRKFNKHIQIHCDIKGQKCKRKLENLQLEDLKSSCLGELMALQINMRERKNRTTNLPGQIEECKLQTSIEGQPSLSITVSNSRVLAVDLTCSICLETLFDPVSLTCSHIFCYMCACSAGSVSTIDGLKFANSKSKCPLCRKAGVFKDAVRMHQLSKLLRRKFPEHWQERRQKDREARLLAAKAHWEFQCRAFVGIN